jgi:ABC-type molybdenum transport system ATPase subunit/photorepair protein PhrA
MKDFYLDTVKTSDKFKSIPADFEWNSINKKLSVITGLNGFGKTHFFRG